MSVTARGHKADQLTIEEYGLIAAGFGIGCLHRQGDQAARGLLVAVLQGGIAPDEIVPIIGDESFEP